MEDEQKLQLEEKIVNLLNRTSPRPNIIEAMEVLENIKNAFQYHLDDNMKSFRKINSPTKPNPRRMVDKIQLKIAKEIAVEAHRGQKRKYSGEDYVNHPRRVAEKFSTTESQIIAWLHDVLEDSDFEARDLLARGISPHLIEIVELLSRQEGESYYNFIMRVKDVRQARIIKIADINDNSSDLKEGTMKDKYRLALHILETQSD